MLTEIIDKNAPPSIAVFCEGGPVQISDLRFKISDFEFHLYIYIY
jgi:hypothetical protein